MNFEKAVKRRKTESLPTSEGIPMSDEKSNNKNIFHKPLPSKAQPNEAQFKEPQPCTSTCTAATHDHGNDANLKSGFDMKTAVTAQNGSNLSLISPVSSCIRIINESGDWSKNCSKNVKSLSLKELKKKAEHANEDGFNFIISLRDGSLINASNLANYLECPKSQLEQQHFENILYYKDHVTFTDHLMRVLNACFIDEGKDHATLGGNMSFARIKKFHSIEDGCVESSQKVEYKPFKITLDIYKLAKDDLINKKAPGTICANANATPILSAYTASEEIPSMSCFSTRHTASCYFTHVDESVIQYTGYLPQDMIGSSIFDFYHLEDMPLMKDIYELVVKERGSTFRSNPYRFKIQNGSYIVLETEWSCFINPWSHSLEFVVGQHRILKGPFDVDIFCPSKKESSFPEEIVKASQTIQSEIKVLLSEDSNSVMGDISPYKDVNDSSFSSDSLSPNVQQICLEGNINRFFASDPKTYSDELDESNKNEKFYQHSQSSNSGSGGSGDISGSTSPSKCQQPSPTNSKNSKNNNNQQASIDVSVDSGYGKTPGQTSSPGTSQEGSPNQAWMKSSSPNGQIESTEMCRPLTKESLSAHNRTNHKQFKQQRKNKSSLGKRSLNSNLLRSKGLNGQKLKRTMSTQTHEKMAAGSLNYSPGNLGGVMPSPFLIPVMLMAGFPSPPNPQTFWPFGSFPGFPTRPSNPEQSTERFEFSNHPNETAGYTQPTTPKFTNHQSSYQTFGFPNFCSYPSRNPVAEYQKSTPQQATRGKCKIQNKKNLKIADVTGSDGNQSQQNISESLESEEPMEHSPSFSFTRSSSFESSDNKKEEMDCGKDNPTTKKSSAKVELPSKISFRYQMTLPSLEDTLKKDREALYKMVQPKLVKEQYRLLQEELKARNKHKLDAGREKFNDAEDIMLGLKTENGFNDELETKEEYLMHVTYQDYI